MAVKRPSRGASPTPEPASEPTGEQVAVAPADTNVVNFLIPLTTVSLLVAIVLIVMEMKRF